jgi:hypothetical protein
MRKRLSQKRKYQEIGTCRWPEYRVWKSMRERCRNQTRRAYASYGAKGVTVCERWSCDSGFMNFIADMGHRPGDGFDLDRIDPFGNYEPGNTRWLPRAVHQRLPHPRKRRALCPLGHIRLPQPNGKWTCRTCRREAERKRRLAA